MTSDKDHVRSLSEVFLFIRVLLALTLLAQPALSATKKKKSKKQTPAVVEQTETPPEQPSWNLFDSAGTLIADSRKGVSDRVILLANKVDGLFGDRRAVDEYYKSSLKVTTSNLYNANNGTHDFNVTTSLNLSLPNLRSREKGLEERWRNYWERNPKDNDPYAISDDEITPDEFKEQNPWDFSSEAGIKWVMPPTYYGKLRASRNYLTGTVVHHFYDEIVWDSATLWNSKASLTSDYAYSEYFLFRFINDINWAMSADVFGTSHGPSWIYTFKDNSLFSFDLRYNTRSIDWVMYTESYVSSFTYRRRFLDVDWIYFQITPQVMWAREDNFYPTVTLNLSVDFLIGEEKKK